MVDAAKSNGKQIIVGFPASLRAEEQADSRSDRRRQLRQDSLRPRQALRRRGIPNWGVFGRKELQGGGPMIDIGVHILETAHYMMGSPRPVAASGNTWTYMGNKPATSRACGRNGTTRPTPSKTWPSGMIRFDNGAMLQIEASFVAHIERTCGTSRSWAKKAAPAGTPPDLHRSQRLHDEHDARLCSASGTYFEYKMRHFVDVCREAAKTNARRAWPDGAEDARWRVPRAEKGKEVEIE